MHMVSMMVRIPDEKWDSFKRKEKEAGSVQFQFEDATIFAKVF